jgi:hypothetical protein
MTDVFAPTEPYRSALAELPLRTRSADLHSGAIVVVPGVEGWVDAAFAAADAGAAALVISNPAFVPSARVRMLAGGAEIPVIVERPLLRTDIAEDAIRSREGVAPRVLLADGAADPSRVHAVVRDSLGWLRVLAGGLLSFSRGDGAVALFETDAGVAAAVSVVATSRLAGGLIRAQALGETITDIQIEGRRAQLVTSSAAGRLIAPVRFESSERLALRRALDSLTAPGAASDLEQLALDTEAVERMLAAAT